MHIIHRDLKPENILIVDRNKNGYPRIKICDFGTSLMAAKGRTQRKFVGSTFYIAPEVIKENYNEKCDIWSCGVILYILLSGRPPFGGDDDGEILANISSGIYDLDSTPFNRISKSARDLIKKLLTKDKRKRLSAQEALNHTWFKEKKAKEMYNQIKDENVVKNLVDNLKTYKRESIIQETALAYLVHNFPQMIEVVNACKLFNQIDINGDGKVTEKELYKGLATKIKSEALAKDVSKIYKNLDLDNNGFIEYEEFVRAAVSKEKFTSDNILRFAFRYFDKDGSGEITFDEIEDVFKTSIRDKANLHNTLKQIIKEVDINGDGVISFDEFAHVMKKMLK
jgi:calcium-dependent protein kinase